MFAAVSDPVGIDVALTCALLRHSSATQQLHPVPHSLHACMPPPRLTVGRARAGEPEAVEDGAASDRAGHAAPVAAARPPGPLSSAPKRCPGCLIKRGSQEASAGATSQTAAKWWWWLVDDMTL